MNLDTLNYSPTIDRELHNFRHSIMRYFPSSLRRSLVTQLTDLAKNTITGHNPNIMTELTVPHFEHMATDLHAIKSETSLLGVFSAQKLINLRDTHLAKLGVDISPRSYSFEATVESVRSGFSNIQDKPIQGEDATNLRSWLYALKQFSDQYMMSITMPDNLYDLKKTSSLVHEFPQRIEAVRAPIATLITYPIQISFKQ